VGKNKTISKGLGMVGREIRWKKGRNGSNLHLSKMILGQNNRHYQLIVN